uniref:S-adenosyl-L-methionine-dependent methyltransferase n=1 Tax=Chrysotila carterae TaxID=13221 RepID=A0A7S4BSD4_CHRCT
MPSLLALQPLLWISALNAQGLSAFSYGLSLNSMSAMPRAPSRTPDTLNAWQARGSYSERPTWLNDVSQSVGVRAPAKAPRWVWSAAWKMGKRALPFLHRWDPCCPQDTCVNLVVVWLKAIAGNRLGKSKGDDGIAFAMLPCYTRLVIARPFCYLYPRLHHQNIAIRSAFLDAALKTEVRQNADDGTKTSVIVLGAGFDGRGLRRMALTPEIEPDRWAEVDLESVVQQKRALLQRALRRRPDLLALSKRISWHAANLSNAEEARGAVCDALLQDAQATSPRSVVYVCEALLIYLPEASARALLSAAVDEAVGAGARRVSFCFADKLPGVQKAFDLDAATEVLAASRLQLDEATWTPKPGLARHMGVARFRNNDAG